MKIIIYAAGNNSRLKIPDRGIPKGLIQITKDKKLIEFGLSWMVRYEPEEIIIVVGHHHELIMNYIGDTYKGVKIKYVFNDNYKLKGNMSSLWAAREYCKQDVIFTVSDLICSDSNIKLFMESSLSDKILVDDNKQYFAEDDPVKVVIKDGYIKEILKKMDPERVSGVAIGIYKLSDEKILLLLEQIAKYMKSGNFDRSLYYAINDLCQISDISPVMCDGSYWFDVDTIEDLEMAEEMINNKEVTIT